MPIPFYVCWSSEFYGETAHIRRLVRAFAARLRDKDLNLKLGHWLDMVYLPPQGEFYRPYFS